MNSSQVRVAVAVITNRSGEILLSRRAAHQHQGGLWEFPGGKCEPGESLRQALARELREELGISVTAAEPLISIPYRYPQLEVLLEVFRVSAFHGQPHGAEGQPLQWVKPQQLNSIALPPANRPIVKAIQLPERYLITPDSSDNDELYRGAMQAAGRGLRLIQLRAPNLSTADYLQLADRLLANLPAYCRLMLKGSAEELAARPRAGWHLTSAQLAQLAGKPRPLPARRLLAASCHNFSQLKLATQLGCDFASLSPVLPTASHPGAPALGWQRARQLTAAAQLPLYWLGGLQQMDVPQIKNLGGQGLAAIRGLWMP